MRPSAVDTPHRTSAGRSSSRPSARIIGSVSARRLLSTSATPARLPIAGSRSRALGLSGVNHPLTVLLDSSVHGVRRQIEFAGPGYRTPIDKDLFEQCLVSQPAKDPRVRRGNQCGQIDLAGEAIGEAHRQAVGW
jgi:hypothetical protein